MTDTPEILSLPRILDPSANGDGETRMMDGVKEFRIITTRGARYLLRAFVGNGGWYNGQKEYKRRKNLAKAIGKDEPPTDKALHETWNAAPAEFWLTDKLKEHARKCLTYHLDHGQMQGGLDDEYFDALMVELGIELKD